MLAKEVYFHSVMLSLPSKYLDFKTSFSRNEQGNRLYLSKEKRAGKRQLQLNLLDKNTLYMLEICDFFQTMFLREADISPNSITAI